MIYAPYERVWVFDQFPRDPFESWLFLANQFDQTGWWPVFMEDAICPEEFQEDNEDGSGLLVKPRGPVEYFVPRVTQRRSVSPPPYQVTPPPNHVFRRNEALSLTVVQVSEPVDAWSVGCPDDADALRYWLPQLYSWYRRFRVVPYVVGQETVMLVLDPPETDEDCLSAYLERLSLTLECGYEQIGVEDNLDWRSVEEFLERAMGIRGRSIWSFWG